jgi:predicted transcriptional regulator
MKATRKFTFKERLVLGIDSNCISCLVSIKFSWYWTNGSSNYQTKEHAEGRRLPISIYELARSMQKISDTLYDIRARSL